MTRFLPIAAAALLCACSSDNSSGPQRDASASDATNDSVIDVVPARDVNNDPEFRDPDAGDVGCPPPSVICGGTIVYPDAGGDSGDDGGDASDAEVEASVIGGMCTSVQTDVMNCGSCGHACTGATAECVGGQCACSGPGYQYCTGGCTDTTSDNNNCGMCGMQCMGGTQCTNAQCQ